MTLIDRISQDIKDAMRASDSERTSTLRLLLASLRNAEIADKKNFSDEIALSVLQREAKKRAEAAAAYVKGNRPELAQKEQNELQLIAAYLPAQLTREEVAAAVDEAIAASGDQRQFGAVMKLAMQKLKGQADGKVVSEIVKEKLSPS